MLSQYKDGVVDKDKTEDEVEGVEAWEMDGGARFAMVPDQRGEYQLVDGIFKPVNNAGIALKPISGPHEDDGSIRVEEAVPSETDEVDEAVEDEGEEEDA